MLKVKRVKGKIKVEKKSEAVPNTTGSVRNPAFSSHSAILLTKKEGRK
jgi:hypothetical protein